MKRSRDKNIQPDSRLLSCDQNCPIGWKIVELMKDIKHSDILDNWHRYISSREVRTANLYKKATFLMHHTLQSFSYYALSLGP